MTKEREITPPVGQMAKTARTVNRHLLQLADGAYAKAARSRRKWRMARLTGTPDVAARFRRQMLKHQAIAYHLDTECRGRDEPR
jgi:hypothetical protein